MYSVLYVSCYLFHVCICKVNVSALSVRLMFLAISFMSVSSCKVNVRRLRVRTRSRSGMLRSCLFRFRSVISHNNQWILFLFHFFLFLSPCTYFGCQLSRAVIPFPNSNLSDLLHSFLCIFLFSVTSLRCAV